MWLGVVLSSGAGDAAPIYMSWPLFASGSGAVLTKHVGIDLSPSYGDQDPLGESSQVKHTRRTLAGR